MKEKRELKELVRFYEERVTNDFNKCEKCGSKASLAIIESIKMIQFHYFHRNLKFDLQYRQ